MIIGLLIVALLMTYFKPWQYLSLEAIKAQLDQFLTYQAANPIKTALIFCAVYIFVAAASIPGAVPMTLLGGAIFGFWQGSILVLTSATLGATIAFLLSRYLFRDAVEKKMGDKVQKINDSFAKEGALYLFSMRLVPALPFFLINLVMGLTPIKTLTYMIASFLGMAAGTMVFVNAGTQLADISSAKELLSVEIIASFLLLAIFPYIAKYILKIIKNKFAKQ